MRKRFSSRGFIPLIPLAIIGIITVVSAITAVISTTELAKNRQITNTRAAGSISTLPGSQGDTNTLPGNNNATEPLYWGQGACKYLNKIGCNLLCVAGRGGQCNKCTNAFYRCDYPPPPPKECSYQNALGCTLWCKGTCEECKPYGLYKCVKDNPTPTPTIDISKYTCLQKPDQNCFRGVGSAKSCEDVGYQTGQGTCPISHRFCCKVPLPTGGATPSNQPPPPGSPTATIPPVGECPGGVKVGKCCSDGVMCKNVAAPNNYPILRCVTDSRCTYAPPASPTKPKKSEGTPADCRAGGGSIDGVDNNNCTARGMSRSDTGTIQVWVDKVYKGDVTATSAAGDDPWSVNLRAKGWITDNNNFHEILIKSMDTCGNWKTADTQGITCSPVSYPSCNLASSNKSETVSVGTVRTYTAECKPKTDINECRVLIKKVGNGNYASGWQYVACKKSPCNYVDYKFKEAGIYYVAVDAVNKSGNRSSGNPWCKWTGPFNDSNKIDCRTKHNAEDCGAHDYIRVTVRVTVQ